MTKVEYEGTIYDSVEEVEVKMWLDEAKKHGIVKSFLYQPPSYILSDKQIYIEEKQLKTKIKIIEKTVFQRHIYTSDYQVWFNYIPFKIIPNAYKSEKAVDMDVKGSFQKHGGDRSFSINRKWVYDKYGIYINKIEPKKLFKETWCPEGARYSPVQKKPRKCYIDCLTIREYLSLKGLN